MSAITRAVAIRHLLESSSVNPLTGCWDWTGAKNKFGYGQISNGFIFDAFETRGAHRLSKMLIDDWTPLDRHDQTRHQCHNRGCINPDHMLSGSAADNAADRRRDGLQKSGQDHSSAKLTDADVVAIRELRGEGASARHLAEQFGVSQGHIYVVASGRTRKAA